MKTSAIALFLCFISIMISLGCKNKVITQDIKSDYFKPYSWQESDSSLLFINGTKVVWQLNYNLKRGKPYFSPLNTIDEHDLVWLRPSDHPWHYGLWFSWKYINDVNFWEEDKSTSLSEGYAKVENVVKTINQDFSATVKMNISYSKEPGIPMLLEKRTYKFTPPDKKGNYYIDWIFDWVAQNDTVTLNRTLPEKLGGPEYGGYAGLSYRATENMSQHKYIHSNNWENKEDIVGYGEKAKWMDLSGYLGESTYASGLTIINHPDNMNDKVPWYIYKKDAFAFFNPSPVFNKPITLLPGERIQYKYRTLINSKALSRFKIEQHYQSFINSNKQEN